MVKKVWARVAVGGLAIGVVGCSSAAPTATQAPADPVTPARAIQATENTMNPDQLRATLPESIPASEASKRLVTIDPSKIIGLPAQAQNSNERSIQQRGWGGRGLGFRGGFGGRGLGFRGGLGGFGLGGLGWGGLGWGGLGWGGGWSGFGWNRGWGDLGYFPYVSIYYPVGNNLYPYYQHGGNYHPYYTSAGAFYSMPGLQVTPMGLYNTASYNWY
ncbi:hypothetical protein J7643_00595 [bacterium]|nr:hypothetical protein [bacterium]